jgi:hypothetical protein
MEFVRSYSSIDFSLPSFPGGSAPALPVSGPAQRSLRIVTACMLAKSPKRPSTPEAPAALLPPPPLRLLPGGTNQFPGGTFTLCGPALLSTAHWKMQASPQIEYRNGFPYQPTNVFQQYVESTPGPQYRFPKYFSLDLRASKDFQVSKKYAVRFSGSLLNLTNHFNALDVHSNIADPQYGRFFGNYQRHFLIDFDVLY